MVESRQPGYMGLVQDPLARLKAPTGDSEIDAITDFDHYNKSALLAFIITKAEFLTIEKARRALNEALENLNTPEGKRTLREVLNGF